MATETVVAPVPSQNQADSGCSEIEISLNVNKETLDDKKLLLYQISKKNGAQDESKTYRNGVQFITDKNNVEKNNNNTGDKNKRVEYNCETNGSNKMEDKINGMDAEPDTASKVSNGHVVENETESKGGVHSVKANINGEKDGNFSKFKITHPTIKREQGTSTVKSNKSVSISECSKTDDEEERYVARARVKRTPPVRKIPASISSPGSRISSSLFDDRTPKVIDLIGCHREVTICGNVDLIRRLPIRLVQHRHLIDQYIKEPGNYEGRYSDYYDAAAKLLDYGNNYIAVRLYDDITRPKLGEFLLAKGWKMIGFATNRDANKTFIVEKWCNIRDH